MSKPYLGDLSVVFELCCSVQTNPEVLKNLSCSSFWAFSMMLRARMERHISRRSRHRQAAFVKIVDPSLHRQYS